MLYQLSFTNWSFDSEIHNMFGGRKVVGIVTGPKDVLADGFEARVRLVVVWTVSTLNIVSLEINSERG